MLAPWQTTELQLELPGLPAHDDDELAALQCVAGPAWRCWRWAGKVYARRLKSSPPVVLTCETAAEVAERISEHDGRTAL
jgi:hypothetical protein